MYFIIHTEDKATKARVGEHVVYNVEWLKKHFNTERKLYEKKGEWVYDEWNPNFPRCSYCGELNDIRTDYCPMCGARMEVENDRD